VRQLGRGVRRNFFAPFPLGRIFWRLIFRAKPRQPGANTFLDGFQTAIVGRHQAPAAFFAVQGAFNWVAGRLWASGGMGDIAGLVGSLLCALDQVQATPMPMISSMPMMIRAGMSAQT
jgi:hypothetical protein